VFFDLSLVSCAFFFRDVDIKTSPAAPVPYPSCPTQVLLPPSALEPRQGLTLLTVFGTSSQDIFSALRKMPLSLCVCQV